MKVVSINIGRAEPLQEPNGIEKLTNSPAYRYRPPPRAARRPDR